MQNCNIVRFEASNFKKLAAVTITPDRQVVVLTGENGAGKSSILDGIEATIVGKKSLPDEPIKHGSTRAVTEVKLSNGLTVTRVYTPGGSTLTVKDADEKVLRSPQAVLDTLVKSLAFDPLEFSRMKPAEQNEVLRSLVNLDTADLDKAMAVTYNSRTEVNREVDRIAAQLPLYPPAPEGTPETEVSITDLLAELHNIKGRNENFDKWQRNVSDAQAEIARAETAAKEARRHIEAWTKVLAGHEAERQRAEQKLSSLQKANLVKEDDMPVRVKLANLENVNKSVRSNQKHKELSQELYSKRAESQSLTDKLTSLELEKKARLQAVKYPLPGLELTPDGIRYNGVLFSQVSDGEKLRVSVAMGMAMNPTLKVIFIRDGSLLDNKGLALVAQMAQENGCQVWMEDARSTDPAAILIEEGKIAE